MKNSKVKAAYPNFPTRHLRGLLRSLVLVLISCSPLWATGTTHYVDATNGSDANDGHSADKAWKTLNKVNSSSFVPGDWILLKRGNSWREKLTVPSKGSEAYPIMVGAYGTGAAPIISAANRVTIWTSQGKANVWQASLSKETKVVIVNSAIGSHKSSISSLASNNQWYWSSSILYLYSTSDPNEKTVEASTRDVCISLNSYCIIDGITVRGAGASSYAAIYGYGDIGITIKNCTVELSYNGIRDGAGASAWKIENCTIRNCRYRGMQISVASTTVTGCTIYNILEADGIIISTKDSKVDGCTIYKIGIEADSYSHYHGIYVNKGNSTGPENVVIQNCDISVIYNGHCIAMCANSGTIRYNYLHDGYDAGIILDQQIRGGLINIYYNIFKGNRYGISLFDYYFNTGTKVKIYNNVFYQNTYIYNGSEPYEIEVQVNVYQLWIKNNIIYRDGVGKAIRMVAQSNMHSNDNCIYYINGQYMAVYDGKFKATLSDWRRATGGDNNSFDDNPLLVDPASGKYWLQENSPCINSGFDVLLTRDFDGNPIQGLPDIGAYEFSYGTSGSTASGTRFQRARPATGLFDARGALARDKAGYRR